MTILSNFCHIFHMLWQILSSVCHIFINFVPSYTFCYFVMTNFVPNLSHLKKFCPIFVTFFGFFIHFLCIKCIFWHFVTFLSHFLSHGTNFVTFLTPQKPSDITGFHVWSKICHIFPNFVPSLSRVCHVHKPRGYAVYT